MNWIPVESRAFAAMAYRRGKRQLYIRFHSGKIYRYFDFPRYQYDELLAAESKGTYFAENIRGKFLYEEVREARLRPHLAYRFGKQVTSESGGPRCGRSLSDGRLRIC
jgi:hypothetical protein